MTTLPSNHAKLGTALLALALVAGGGWIALASGPPDSAASARSEPVAPTSDGPAPPQEDAEPAAEPTDGSPDRTLDGCTEQIEMWTIPAPAADRLTPEGFDPVNPAPVGATAVAFFVGFECQRLDASGSPAAALLGGLLVEPPEDRAGEADKHAIVVEAWSDAPEVRESFRNWSWGTVHGADVSVEVAADAGTSRTGLLEASWDANTIEVASEVAGPTGEIEDFEMRVFGLGPGGDVDATVDWAFGPGTSQGAGTAVFVSDRPAVLPPPTQPGLAFHAWGPDYGYAFERVDENGTSENGTSGSNDADPSRGAHPLQTP